MQHLRLLALVLAFTACGKGKDSAGSGSGSASGAATPPTESSGFDKLKVDLAGKPIAMTKAFIKRIPVDGRYQLFLSDDNGTCQELLDNSFNHMSDNAILVDVGPRLQPDNTTFKTEVTDLYSGPDDAKVKPGSNVTITGNADKGTKVDVTIDADITVTGSKRPGAIGLHGSFTAEGCGARAETLHDGEPKAAHPSKATVTIGGKALPIVGAIFKGAKPEAAGKQRNLFLSTGPKDCSGTTPWAAFKLERTWGDWKLSGVFIGTNERSNSSASGPDGQPETKGLTVKLGATGTSADGPTVQIELAGTGTIDNVPVKLEGTVEAIDCPE